MTALTARQMARWVRLDLAVPGTVELENDRGKVKVSVPVIWKPHITSGTLGIFPGGIPSEMPPYRVKRCGNFFLVQRDGDGELINERQWLGYYYPGCTITIAPARRPSWMTNP